jgi:tight adherence protein B
MKLDPLFVLFGLLAFIAVFIALEAIYIWWSEKYSNEAKRLQTRLQKISNDNDLFIQQHSILKNRLRDNEHVWLDYLSRIVDLQKIDSLMMQSGKFWSINQFVQYSIIALFVGVIIGLMIDKGIVITLILGFASMFIPYIYIQREKNKRFDKLEAQLPEAIDSIARSLKAGHSFMSAFSMIGEELQDPIATEFRVSLEETNLGVPLNEALLNLSKRVPITDLKFFVIAILIQRESGGNLAEILTSMSKIIRERFKLMGEVKTLSAEGVMSAKVMWAMPFLMIGLMSAIAPYYGPILFGTPTGIFFLKVGFVMMVIGGLWMRKVVKIRV